MFQTEILWLNVRSVDLSFLVVDWVKHVGFEVVLALGEEIVHTIHSYSEM